MRLRVVIIFCLLGFIVASLPAEDKIYENLSKAKFTWKAMWIRGGTVSTPEKLEKAILLVKEMGFNTILIQATGGGGTAYYKSDLLKHCLKGKFDVIAEAVRLGHKHGLKVYTWTVNLAVTPPEIVKTHPELLQKVKPEDIVFAKKPRVNSDRPNIHSGNWFCPDRGVTELEKNIFREIITKYDIDGIALDYLGYRNYYACFCDFSKKKRVEFRKQHPELSDKAAMREFSEKSLAEWTKQARKIILNLNPKLKIAIHVYPDFDPNLPYANRLAVDYCGETVAWFYKPFWPLKKVEGLVELYKKNQHKYHSYYHFVPFVGIYPDERKKSPERLRAEIRIAGQAGNGTIMVAFLGTFIKHPDLVRILKEELNYAGR